MPVGEGRLPANKAVQPSSAGDSSALRPYAQFPDIEALRGLRSIAMRSMASCGVPNRLHLTDRLILHVAAR
jgi:hypothetical protein